jgi:FlaA1/EpsC-like NDP-sugar epimerase
MLLVGLVLATMPAIALLIRMEGLDAV